MGARLASFNTAPAFSLHHHRMFSMLSKSIAVCTAIVLLLAAPQEMLSGDADLITKLITNGGITAILVYIWWKTHTQANEEQQKLRDVIGDAFEATRQNSREVAKQNQQRHAQRQDRMMTIISDRIKLDRKLTGVLNRLETKIDKIDHE